MATRYHKKYRRENELLKQKNKEVIITASLL